MACALLNDDHINVECLIVNQWLIVTWILSYYLKLMYMAILTHSDSPTIEFRVTYWNEVDNNYKSPTFIGLKKIVQ